MVTRSLIRPDIRRDFSELDGDVLLDTLEAAAALGLSPWTLRGWRQRGLREGPPTLRLGAAVRYPVGGIRTWLEKHRADTSDLGNDHNQN